MLTLGDRAETEALFASAFAALTAQQPDLTVQFVPTTANVVTARTALPLAQSADVLVAAIADPPAAADAFLDVAPLRDADPAFDATAFWPGLADACHAGDRLLGLPLAVEPLVFMADPAAFTAAGIPLPQPGWTWGDFVATVRALTTEGDTPRYGFAAVGGLPFATRTRQPDDATRAQYEDYVALAQAEALPPADADVDALLQQRRIALWTDTLLNLPIRQQERPDGVVVLPVPGGRTPVGVTCGLISAGTQQREDAWALLRTLTTTRIRSAWWEVPARRDVATATAAVWNGVDPVVRTVVEDALTQAVVSDPQAARDVQTALEQAITEQRPIAEVLAALPTTADAPRSTAPPLAVASPVPTASADMTVIRLFAGGFIGSQIRPGIERFTRANPTYRVQLVPDTAVLRNGIADPAQLAATSDCAIIDRFASADTLDLQPLLDADATGIVNDLSPRMLENLRAQGNGRLLELPLSQDTVLMYYNRTVLAELGIAEPTGNWDADAMLTAIEQAARPDADPPIYGFVPYTRSLLSLLVSARSIDLTSRPVTDPDVQRLVAQIRAAASRGTIPAAGVITPDDGTGDQNEQLILNGQAVFWGGGAESTIGAFQAADGQIVSSIDRGVVALPASTIGYGGFIFSPFQISARVADPQPCWKLWQFLSLDAASLLPVPVRASVRESAAWGERYGAEADVYRLAYARSDGRLFPDGVTSIGVLSQALPRLTETALEPELAVVQQDIEALNACLAAATTSEARNVCYGIPPP